MSDMLDPPSAGPGRRILLALGIVAVLVGGVYVVYTTFDDLGGLGGKSSLRANGVEAPAQIVAVTQTRSRVNDDWVFDVELQVSPKGMASYGARVSQPLSVIHVPNLKQGGWVRVKFDRDNPQDLVIMSTGDAPPDTPSTQPVESSAATPKRQTDPAQVQPAKAEASVDPVCEATTRCCLVAMGDDARASCEAFSNTDMAATACAGALQSYVATAKKNGRSCE